MLLWWVGRWADVRDLQAFAALRQHTQYRQMAMPIAIARPKAMPTPDAAHQTVNHDSVLLNIFLRAYQAVISNWSGACTAAVQMTGQVRLPAWHPSGHFWGNGTGAGLGAIMGMPAGAGPGAAEVVGAGGSAGEEAWLALGALLGDSAGAGDGVLAGGLAGDGSGVAAGAVLLSLGVNAGDSAVGRWGTPP